MNNRDFSVTHRWVPPYTSSIDKTFSPGERRWITADVAALPDEKATLCWKQLGWVHYQRFVKTGAHKDRQELTNTWSFPRQRPLSRRHLRVLIAFKICLVHHAKKVPLIAFKLCLVHHNYYLSTYLWLDCLSSSIHNPYQSYSDRLWNGTSDLRKMSNLEFKWEFMSQDYDDGHTLSLT